LQIRFKLNKELDDGERFLVERCAVGGDRSIASEEPFRRAPGRRSASDQRDRSCAEGWLSLAGLPLPLRPANDDLQPLSSMVGTRRLAEAVSRLGNSKPQRHSHDRQHHSKGSSLGSGRKRGAEEQAIGRSRGGRTTKIHAVVDSHGRPLAFEITPGQRGDVRLVLPLLSSLPAARLCAADAAYDSDGFRLFLRQRGTIPVIPNNPTRKRTYPFDTEAYKLRNLIERMFCRLKDWRRIATRYDKLARNFEAAVSIAAFITWWTN
jgi:transposase